MARPAETVYLMYAGHFAAGLAIKAVQPRVPTWAVLLAVGFLDVLFGVLVLLGVERVTMTPGDAPGFRLDFIDWSHSLAASLFWAALLGLAFLPRGRAVAFWIGLAVFSHFVLDWPMHPGDLALWPHAGTHVGIGLWRIWPRGWWWFELAFVALCCVVYVVRARRIGGFGGHRLAACAVVLLLHLVNSPWASPTH